MVAVKCPRYSLLPTEIGELLLLFFQSCLVDNTMCNLTGKYRVKKISNTPTILTKPKILRKVLISFPLFQNETVTVTAVVNIEAKIGLFEI